MDTLETAGNSQTSHKYCCLKCKYYTDKKSNYDSHLLTRKHFWKQNWIQPETKKPADNICKICDKIFANRSGLWKHKKKCNQNNFDNEDYEDNQNKNNIASTCVITPELIVELIKAQIKTSDNMTQMLIEHSNTFQNTIQTLVTNGINNSSQNIVQNNSNNNSNNKSFNLQFFLNETCKNAMNIIDFANSIQLKLTDLESVGELGYVDGISKIIVDNLKLLDITVRPVHCSDLKRESLYVKNNNNEWEKENDDNPNLKKLINSVTNKNIPLIKEWKQKYPDSNKCDSIKSTQINKIIMEVMETDPLKKEKIVKKIAKEVVIHKAD